MYRLWRKNIRTSLAITIGTFVVLIILVLGWVHYFSVSQAVMKDVYEKQLITSLRAHQSSLQALLERAIETSEILADDPALIEWFSSNGENSKAKELALKKLDKLQQDFGYPTVFAVSKKTHEYWREGNNLLDIVSEDDPDDSWFFETLSSKRKSTLNFDYNNELNETILFVNVLMGDASNPIGVAGVGIDPSVLIEQFKNDKNTKNSFLWLIDKSGKIIMSEHIEEINQPLNEILDKNIVSNLFNKNTKTIIQDSEFKNEKVEVAAMNVGETDYLVVLVVSEKDLLAILDVISLNTIWLTFIILILTLMVVSILAKRITTPIIRLTNLSNALAQRQLDFKVDDELILRNDEIGQLAQGFDFMQTQLTTVIERLNTANHHLLSERQQLKNTNNQLEEALNKASESERLTKAFLANISHEIRTPMNSIMGFGQILEEEKPDDETLKNYAGIIVKNGQQLLAILNNIIDVSKMDSGLTKPNWNEVSAQKVIQDAFDLFSYAARDGLSIINKARETKDDVLFTSDRLMVRQVVNNLVSNSIKYTYEGTIEINYKTTDNQVIFYVSDTGIGIPQKDRISIFKPFWQVNRETSINEGAGLGLAISKKIADVLNGEIWVESEVNVGSVFYFSLPISHQ